jgi:hypothetical protein
MDVGDVPPGQHREGLRLALATLRQFGTISSGRIARAVPRPRVAKDVPPLKVRAIGCFLENEIFRKMRGVVADVQPGHEHALAA